MFCCVCLGGVYNGRIYFTPPFDIKVSGLPCITVPEFSHFYSQITLCLSLFSHEIATLSEIYSPLLSVFIVRTTLVDFKSVIL